MIPVAPTLLAMRPELRAFRLSRWGRPLVVLLVGALLIQSGPVREIVQEAQVAWGSQHQCAHASHDVCPRNPDGACTCAHPEPVESESKGPIIRACNGGSDAVSPITVPQWQSTPTAPVPSPRVSADDLQGIHLSLSSQRLVDEVFRPPRMTPLVRLS